MSIALEVGVNDKELAAIENRDFSIFEERGTAQLKLSIAVTGETQSDKRLVLTEFVDGGTMVGIAMLASHYVATARFIEVMRIEPQL
jgi:hypothetical protein